MGWSYPHLWSDTRFNKDSELKNNGSSGKCVVHKAGIHDNADWDLQYNDFAFYFL